MRLVHWKYVERGARFGTDSLLLHLDPYALAKKGVHIAQWFQSFQTLTFCACHRGVSIYDCVGARLYGRDVL